MDAGTHRAQQNVRMLAAIVFTDVVGYSVLAGRDESQTLTSTARDFELMRRLCEQHGGQVLKNTGDGLLMCFTSAVEAVTSALEMQKSLHEASEALPKSEVLQHRIGIHLGDVVASENDVVGDGVNVASRIQSEAKPGSICLSQTVYDVVKGKVNLKAVCLGPRSMKHIVEPVVVWQVPPIGTPDRGQYLTTAAPKEIELQFAEAAAPKNEGLRLGLILMAVLGLLLVPIILVPMALQSATKKQAQGESKASTTAKSEQPAQKQPSEDKAAVPAEKPATAASTPLAQSDEEAEPIADSEIGDPGLREQFAQMRRQYDFGGIVQALERNPTGDSNRKQLLISRYRRLGEFRTWLESKLLTTQKDAPISAGPLKAYAGPEGSFILESPTGSGETAFADLAPEQIVALAGAAIRDERNPAARRGLATFAREYGVRP